MNRKIARLGTEAQDYERLGLKKNTIQQWEDGLRTKCASPELQLQFWAVMLFHVRCKPLLCSAEHKESDNAHRHIGRCLIEPQTVQP